MSSHSRAVALVVLVAIGCAPAAEPVPPAPRRVQGAEVYRPLDGLLGSPTLQRLVEAQVDREADVLVAALADADARVRARAAFALASVQDTSAVPALIAALADEDPAVRADVAHALGQTPAPAGAAALLERLSVELDTAVLVVTLDALGRAGGAAELAALTALELAEARGDSSGLPAAVALAYARFAMRGHSSDAATDWLIEALRGGDRAVRENAAYAFARARDTASYAERRDDLVGALARLAASDRAAMHLLGALARLAPREDDIAIFSEWLTTASDWAVRTNAARALGRRADSSGARAALITALDDASPHVRNAAAAALAPAPLGIAEANALLARLAQHEAEAPVHGALLRAIARAGRTDAVLERWIANADPALRRAGAAAVVFAPGVAAFEHLAAAAEGPDSMIAAAAVEALVERRALDLPDATDERYFDTFATALRTRDLAVSFSAASALADRAFADLGAGPLLQSVLLQMRAPDDAEVMVEMVRALGALRDSTAVALLRELRAGRSHELRTAAAAALSQITGEPSSLPPGGPAPTRLMQWDWLARWGDAPRLRIETERGTIVLELSTEQAPLTTQTMLSLAAEGRFDDTPFHRVVPNFVIQGGDVSRGDGWGGPGFAIRTELTRIPYLRGTAGMASSGKDTEGSQWFVTHSMQPHLDVAYSAFGTVVDGLRVVDAIREGDRVIRVTAEPTAP